VAALTLTQAQAQLDAWLAASLAVAQAQSYEIAGRRLTRADAEEIRKNIEHWRVQVSTIAASGSGRSGRTRSVLLGG